METGLAGKRVLVTGGGGGIGSACVRAFAAEGARVAVHYRTSRDRAEELARETGGVALPARTSRWRARSTTLFEAAERELGGVDVCAAVAGVWPRADEPVWELPLERWEATLARTSLRPSSRRAGSSASSSARATAISSSSARPPAASARQGTPTTRRRRRRSRSGCCSASRTRSCAIAPRGRVNAVAPGWTYSPMTRGDARSGARRPRSAGRWRCARSRVAEDVARAVVVLASDELSGHVTRRARDGRRAGAAGSSRRMSRTDRPGSAARDA